MQMFADHMSLWVVDVQLAVNFFKSLGWEIADNRNPVWDTGQAQFMVRRDNAVALQLTEERDQLAGASGSALHLGFKCDVVEALETMKDFCRGNNQAIDVEDVGGGKMMVQVPSIFRCCALELVPIRQQQQ